MMLSGGHYVRANQALPQLGLAPSHLVRPWATAGREWSTSQADQRVVLVHLFGVKPLLFSPHWDYILHFQASCSMMFPCSHLLGFLCRPILSHYFDG